MSHKLKPLTATEIEQVNGAGALFSIESATVRNLTVATTPISPRIGNVAICSSCHGCTKLDFDPSGPISDPGGTF